MRRALGSGGGVGRRLPSTKFFAAGNLVAIVALYGYVQWRISSTDSTAVRLMGGAVDVGPPPPHPPIGTPPYSFS